MTESKVMDQNLIDLLRKTVPNRIAEELISVQKIDLSIEDLNAACNVIAAMHNRNHPEDNWPTSLVAVMDKNLNP